MQKLIVGNLKMNLLTLAERERYFESFKKGMKGKKFVNSHIVLCPPSLHVESFIKKMKQKNVAIGVQNIFWEDRGSYTGEISAPMTKHIGAEYVILGHSDQRRYFNENDEKINLKITAALKSGLKVVLCIGENGEQKKSGDGEKAISDQLQGCLGNISPAKIGNVMVCYEPVWAISSNNPDHLPSTNEIMTAKMLIRKFLVVKYGTRVAEKIKLIYGGSVARRNVEETCIEPEMDGVLVGRESLIPGEFLKIAEIIDNHKT
jgi:triosephosphate isomerase (TIM)